MGWEWGVSGYGEGYGRAGGGEGGGRGLRGDRVGPYGPRVTVLEAIQRSSDFLSRKGVDSPRLQSELLLAHVLRLTRMKLYLSFDRVLTDAEVEASRGLVQRRGQREPLQHILGTVCFCGHEITVNRDVLIPRPETELLVEQAVRWVQARGGAARVLDFGTGSGCIALAMAAACPAAEVMALDVSPAALAVARANAARLDPAGRVSWMEGAGLESLPAGMTYDLVVTNPPYIATAEIETLEPEVRDHDPRLALDGGADGLEFYRRLAGGLGARLAPGGVAMMEFGAGQGAAIRDLFLGGAPGRWAVDELLKDYSGLERILIARRVD